MYGFLGTIGKLIGMLLMILTILIVIVMFITGDYVAALVFIIITALIWKVMNIGETRRKLRNRKEIKGFTNSVATIGVRKIKITRKTTKLVARWIPYHCIVGYDVAEFQKYLKQQDYALNEDAMKNLDLNPLSYQVYKNMPRAFNPENFKAYLDIFNLGETVRIIPIESSETKIVEIGTQETSIFVASFTSSGAVVGNQIYINEGLENKSFIVETKYNWKTGGEVLIREEL